MNQSAKKEAKSPDRTALIILGTAILLLLASPSIAQQGGDPGKLKASATNWLKEHLEKPETYRSQEWGKVVTHSQGGRSYSIRHVYQFQDRSGEVQTVDRIFAFDLMGNVMGVENVPAGANPIWHNKRP
jgi:hypothetical protein